MIQKALQSERIMVDGVSAQRAERAKMPEFIKIGESAPFRIVRLSSIVEVASEANGDILVWYLRGQETCAIHLTQGTDEFLAVLDWINAEAFHVGLCPQCGGTGTLKLKPGYNYADVSGAQLCSHCHGTGKRAAAKPIEPPLNEET